MLPAAAQTSKPPERPYIQAEGEATIAAQPDQAVVELGVTTQAPTSAGAAAENARQTQKLMALLNGLPAAHRKLRTTSYTVQPDYQYPKPGASPTISGYTATNVVEVTLDDLALVSEVLTISTPGGANLVRSLRYGLKDPGAVRAEALRHAAAQARRNAEAMAAGVGLKLGRVLALEQVTQGPGIVPLFKSAMTASAPAVPVESGTIDVPAKVTLRVELEQ